MWSLTDEALLAGMGAGDAEAAAGFVRRFQARVYGLALTVLGDSGAAEDVAQETFVKAWRHASAYDPRRGQVATWVLSIARNTAVDAARTRRANPVDPRELVLLCERRGEGGTPDMVLADELDRLKGALREIPMEQKVALFQSAFYGRTAREIGELDDVPVGTIKTRIRSALMKLRSSLEVTDDL